MKLWISISCLLGLGIIGYLKEFDLGIEKFTYWDHPGNNSMLLFEHNNETKEGEVDPQMLNLLKVMVMIYCNNYLQDWGERSVCHYQVHSIFHQHNHCNFSSKSETHHHYEKPYVILNRIKGHWDVWRNEKRKEQLTNVNESQI